VRRAEIEDEDASDEREVGWDGEALSICCGGGRCPGTGQELAALDAAVKQKTAAAGAASGEFWP
jgi:hypothetical protein